MLTLHPGNPRPGDPVIRALQIAPLGNGQAWLDSHGGEIAFEVDVDGQTKLAVARIVAVNIKSGAEVSVLVRVPGEFAGGLRAGKTVRCFRAYKFKVPVNLSAAGSGKIVLPLDEVTATRTGYLAVSARRGDNPPILGPLCAPVGFTLIRLAPVGRPSAPFPAGFSSAEAAGYASPPDAEGRSTIHLEWNVGEVNPATGLRSEVARALDSAIPIAHRRNWLGGRAADNTHSIRPGAAAGGTLSEVPQEPDPGSGLYKASFISGASLPPDTDFRGGRLQQGSNYFEITFASKSGGILRLLLRPVNHNAPTNAGATIQVTPDYSDALRNDTALRAIAAENEEVFALATGAPIAATTFRDEVPGLGNARFFYRVRALDVAGNATAWSAASCPFHQVDMTLPRTPDITHSIGGRGEARITLQIDHDAHGYIVFRSANRAELESSAGGSLGTRVTIVPQAQRERVYMDQVSTGLPAGNVHYRFAAFRKVSTGPSQEQETELMSPMSAIITVTVLPATADV
jgi:hypothetical protein